jgi:ketosteroid isomerase-like protein
MPNPTTQTIIQQWIASFNNQDVHAIVNLYAIDATHYSPRLLKMQPNTNGLIAGHEALKNWWLDAFKRLPTLQYELLEIVENAEEVIISYKRIVDGEEPTIVQESFVIEDGWITKSTVL